MITAARLDHSAWDKQAEIGNEATRVMSDGRKNVGVRRDLCTIHDEEEDPDGRGSRLHGVAFIRGGRENEFSRTMTTVKRGKETQGGLYSSLRLQPPPPLQLDLDGGGGCSSSNGNMRSTRLVGELRTEDRQDDHDDGNRRNTSLEWVSPPSSSPSETALESVEDGDRAGPGAAEKARIALQLWWPLLAGLSGGAGDPRLDCRSAALSTLQDVLQVRGKHNPRFGSEEGGLPLLMKNYCVFFIVMPRRRCGHSLFSGLSDLTNDVGSFC